MTGPLAEHDAEHGDPRQTGDARDRRAGRDGDVRSEQAAHGDGDACPASPGRGLLRSSNGEPQRLQLGHDVVDSAAEFDRGVGADADLCGLCKRLRRGVCSASAAAARCRRGVARIRCAESSCACSDARVALVRRGVQPRLAATCVSRRLSAVSSSSPRLAISQHSSTPRCTCSRDRIHLRSQRPGRSRGDDLVVATLRRLRCADRATPRLAERERVDVRCAVDAATSAPGGCDDHARRDHHDADDGCRHGCTVMAPPSWGRG